jgi:hypothetical protein
MGHSQNLEKNGQLFSTQSFAKSRTSLEIDGTLNIAKKMFDCSIDR